MIRLLAHMVMSGVRKLLQQLRSQTARWERLLDTALPFVGFGVAFLAVRDLRHYLHPWAVTIAWLALVVAILAGSFLRGHRSSRFLSRFLTGFSLYLCLGLMVVEGWLSLRVSAMSLLQFAAFTGSICVIWFAARRRTRVPRPAGALRHVDGTANFTGVIFLDDGERIVVRADKQSMQAWAILWIFLALAGIAAAFWTAPLDSGDYAGLGCGLLVALWIGLSTLITVSAISRLVRSTPSLVVSPDGILDTASRWVMGEELVHWDEITEVKQVIMQPSKRSPVQRTLAITVSNAVAVGQRQKLWRRLLGLTIRGIGSTTIHIGPDFLDRPPDVLAAEIKRYAARHAPKEWNSPLIERVGEAESEGKGERL